MFNNPNKKKRPMLPAPSVCADSVTSTAAM